jgi:hypothetical protein
MFRYFYRRNIEKRWRHLLPPENLKDIVNTADSLNQWQAFRHLFFPKSILRDRRPEDIKALHDMIGGVLEKHDNEQEPPTA